MSGDYLAHLRISIEPGPGVVASRRGSLLVVPAVDPGQEEALDALQSAASGRAAERAVARVMADFDRVRVPAFCLIAAGEGAPFAVLHGPVALTVRGAGAETVSLSGLGCRLWAEAALPHIVEQVIVRADRGGEGGPGPVVLEATAAGELLRTGPDAEIPPAEIPPAEIPPAEIPPAEMPRTAAQPAGRPSEEPAEQPAQESAGEPTGEAERTDPASGREPAAAREPVSEGEPAVQHDPAVQHEPAAEPESADEPSPVATAGPAGPSAGGSSSVEFRPEPIRFGPGGRIEPVSFAGTVNGAQDAPEDASAPVPAAAPFASPPSGEAPERPLHGPRPSAASYAATQLVAPPEPGLFPGAVPPPVPPGFDPFGAAALRSPEPASAAQPEQPAISGGERTGLGRLVMENGPDVVVDGDCVIGRNPEVDPDVAQSRAKAIVLPDAEQRISRVHARLVFTDHGVEIVDAGSVNGTWIEPPSGAGWIAMVPRVPAPLPLGSRIQVGDLVLSYVPVDDDG